jgi:hypothetical protein
MVKALKKLLFGAGGNATEFMGKGWSVPERGFTWAIGKKSEMRVPIPSTDARLLLTMNVVPLTHKGVHPTQRLRISVNGHEIVNESLERSRVLAEILPKSAVSRQDSLRITLDHPDAVRVRDVLPYDDDRKLSVAVSLLRLDEVAPASEKGLDAAARDIELPTNQILVSAFESLGDNCEFGLVQRRLGADPLGLLRFSAVSLETLFQLLHNEFRDLANLDCLEVECQPLESGDSEYLIYNSLYNLRYHTFSLASQHSLEQVTRRELGRLKLASRALLERLRDGSRILVFKHSPDLSEGELLALWLAIQEFGPTTLLSVAVATGDNVAGSVKVVRENLLRGFVSGYAPYDNAGAGDDASWLLVCQEAYRLWQSWRAGASEHATPDPVV